MHPPTLRSLYKGDRHTVFLDLSGCKHVKLEVPDFDVPYLKNSKEKMLVRKSVEVCLNGVKLAAMLTEEDGIKPKVRALSICTHRTRVLTMRARARS